MTNVLEINGKKLHPIKEAAKLVSYSRDYLTRLAREDKIVSSHIGRQWYVDLESLKSYVESAEIEHEIRKKRLSQERKLEQKIESVSSYKQKNEKRARTIHLRATLATAFVLTLGLTSGGVTALVVSGEYSTGPLVANTAKSSVPDSGSALVSLPEVKEAKLTEATRSEDKFVATEDIRTIGEDIKNGVLLLPQGSINSSVPDMFSDEVVILTAEDGTKTVVRVDENGVPTGKVIPFVNVPVSVEGI